MLTMQVQTLLPFDHWVDAMIDRSGLILEMAVTDPAYDKGDPAEPANPAL